MEVKTGGVWELTDQARVVTFIGASGKTTALLRLATELGEAGRPFVLTTSTKVLPFSLPGVWQSTVSPPPFANSQDCFWYGQTDEESGKWVGPSLEVIDEGIRRRDDLVWGIEGDGARTHALKCWAAHEPQMPAQTQWGVLLLNASLWGKILLAEEVHRPEYCPDLLGQRWDSESCWAYLYRSPIFYPQFACFRWVVLFNDHGLSKHETELDELLVKMSNKYFADWRDPTNPTDPTDRTDPRDPRDQTARTESPAIRLAAGNVKEGTLRWLDLF